MTAMPILHAITYCLVALAMLTGLGNAVCQLMLRIFGMKAANTLSDGVDRAGHLIGGLERLIIFAGVLCHSWEIVAAVIALKTIARFKTLDETVPAEYFLVGSLFSLLWALLVAGVWLGYDHALGINLRAHVAELVNPPDKENGSKAVHVQVTLPRPEPSGPAARDGPACPRTMQEDRAARPVRSQGRHGQKLCTGHMAPAGSDGLDWSRRSAAPVAGAPLDSATPSP